MANSVKQHGRVYTPNYLVRQILDFGGYNTDVIIGRNVIDNSCGDGAFLTEIVSRYCSIYKGNNLKVHLETFIHGIEIEHSECEVCKHNLSRIAEHYGVHNVVWDIQCADALTIDKYNGKMDYVFGNPPYVRVHNLNNNYGIVKQFSFAQQGMTDLFIVFFELGFRLMKSDGTMCIITPSSWFSSKAGYALRQYIISHNNLSGIIDLGHFQPFSATTYTAISRFQNNAEKVELYRYIDELHPFIKIDTLSVSEIIIKHNLYISDRTHLEELKSILNGKAYKYVEVKNGFATLADKIFIGKFEFEEGLIDVLKASTGKWYKCIFPYDNHGRPLPPTLIERQSRLYQYLCQHKEQLSHQRDTEDNNLWYLFGRTQAIKDVAKDKYAINTIIRDKKSIRFEKVAKGKGVFSGLYILTDIPENEVRDLIVSDDFVSYVQMLSNYKSGGYYTFSSKDIEQYLNYKLSQKYGQSRISKGNLELF